MVKLSVIGSYCNVERYAADSLLSLMSNTDSDFEFVIVDDGSTDATTDVVDHLMNQLRGAVVIRHETNRGASAARNTGLKAARGRYLTFLDGDDWLAPGYLGQLVDAIEHFGCDFLRTDHVRVTGRERKIHRAPELRRARVLAPRDSILPIDQTSMVDYPVSWAGIYDRRLLDAGLLWFDESLQTAEDRPFIWRLHCNAASFAVVGLHGYRYRRGVGRSLTQVGDQRQLHFIRAYDEILDSLTVAPDLSRFLPKAIRTYCALIVFHIGQAGRLEPAVAQELRVSCAHALARMPQEVLEGVVDNMDPSRAQIIGELRVGSGVTA